MLSKLTCVDTFTKDEMIDLIQDCPEGLFADKKKRKVFLPHAEYKLFDTHTHLASLRTLTPDVAVVRALLAGVHTIVIPFDPECDAEKLEGLSPDDWICEVSASARKIYEKWQTFGLPLYNAQDDSEELFERIFYTTGTHPYGAKAYLESQAIQECHGFWRKGKLNVGVGEIGLDFGPYNELPEDIQRKAFEEQLQIAIAEDMVVELHLRDGSNDTRAHDLALEILDTYTPKRVDYHCFTSGSDVIGKSGAKGYYHAFGGALTFNNSEDIRQAALLLDDSLLLSETDAPYMTPVPLRGIGAEPAHVLFTVARLAELRADKLNKSYGATWEHLYKNACHFFDLAE